MKLRLLLLVFLVSGFAFAQTTVTLQDQCNCEVLSGTAVTVPGAINPSGADTGDIYVNTNTGTIYFWDGDSWELTSTDDQQLQNFSFNGATSILTLDIEDGNSVSVDLSALSNSGTDDQALSLVGNILTLEDGGTVNLAPYLDNTDDQTITAFSLDASNILTITLESGNTRTVDLSTLIGTDDQTATEVNYDNTTSGLTAANVQDAIDEINAAAGTVALVDNGDGTYDFTDASGAVTTISDTSISTLADNADGTYTYTDETGATQTIDTNAGSNPYDNTTSGLTATDVQAAIDEINAAAGTVALVDNGDGTYDFTDAGGNTTTITDTSISTLVDNADGTFTYTNEDGVATTFDAKIATVVDNLDGTYTITDDFGTSVTIDTNNVITTLVDNGDGSFTYTSEDGTITTFTETLSGLVDNADGTFTYTNEDGVATTFDAKIATVVDNLDGTYTITDDFGTSVTIDTNNVITTLVDNGDGSFTYTSEDGTITTFTESLSGLVDNADGTFTYTNEDGVATTFDAKIATVVDNLDGTYTITDDFGTSVTIDTNNVITTLVDNGDGSFTYTSEDGTITTFTETLSGLVDNGNGTFTYTDEDGAATTFDAKIATVVDNLDGTYTITDDFGTSVTIDTNNVITTLVDNGDGSFTYTSEDGTITTFTETLSGLVDNGNGTFTYTDEDGAATTFDAKIATVVDNLDGTYTITDDFGTSVTIDTNNVITTLVDNGDGSFTYTSEDGTITTFTETLSGLVDNGNGTFTYTDEDGAATTFDAKIATVVDNLDGTYTITDDFGTSVTIDTNNVITTLVDNGDGSFTYTSEDGTITTFTETLSGLVDNGNGTFTYTDEDGAATTFDAKIATVVDNLDGTYTITDDFGTSVTIDTNNVITTLVDNGDGSFTYTSEDGTITTFTETLSGLVDNGNGTFTYTDEDGAATTFDAKIATVVDNLDGTYTITDDFGTSVTIDTNNVITTLVDNGDGSFTYTSEDGTITTFTETLSGLVDNGNGTYTYTNEDGATQTIDTNAGSNPYDNTASSLTATDVQAAIDELSAGSSDDQNLTGATLDGANQLQIDIENGSSTTVDLSSLAETVIAGTGAITVTDDGNGNYTVNSTDPDEDLTNELTLIGAGVPVVIPSNSGVTYVDSVAGQLYVYDGAAWQAVGGSSSPDLDGDPTNEQNTAFAVNAGNLEITDSGGTLSVPLTSLGTDDQDISTDGTAGNITIEDGSTLVLNVNDADSDATNEYNTGVSFDGTNLTVTDAGGNQSADISGLDTDDQTLSILGDQLSIADGNTVTVPTADGSETIVTGAGINVVTGTGTTADPYIITATEVDGSVNNEINTAFAVNAGNLEITDSDGTLSVPLASLGTDDQNIDVLTLNAATNILTVGIENGSDLTVDLSGLVADGSETIVTGAGINVVTGTGTTADPYIITATEVDGSVTNEINTAFAVNAGNLEITDSDGTLSVPLASLGTDDQNIDVLTLNAATNILTVGIEDGSDLTVDLSGLVADGSETIVTGAGINVVTGTGTTADPYIITATEVDGSVTNEINTAFAVNAGNLEITDSDGTLSVPLASLGTDDQNIDVLTLNAATNILTVGIENGSDLTVDLSGLVADGSETIVTGAGINVVTGTGTTADPYIITATEVDGSVTNEINTAFAVNAGNLEITDSDGTLSVPLASLGTDDQNIDVLTLNAATNILTVGIEDGSDLTVDLSGLVADGSETIVTGAGINVVTGTGTTADPYIITATEVDGSVINELTLIGAGFPAVIPSNSGVTYVDSVAGQLYVYDGVAWNAVGGSASPDLDGDPTNEQNTAFAVNAGNLEITDSGGTLSVPLASLGTDDQNIDVLTLNAATNILTVGIENGSDLTVDLSGLVADGSETIVTGAGINVVTGTGTTADPYIITATEVDGSVTNEINTAFAVNAGNLEITDSDGTLSVPLASLGTDDQNIDVLTLNAATNILTVGIENGSDLTVDLSGLVADGSETIVTGAGINVVTGTGTTADPYIITATEVDGSVTNEINTAFAVNAGNLEITDSDGTLSVPLASLGTDDQNIDVLTLNAATNILTVGIENGSDLTVDLSGLVADGSETIVTGAGINVVTGTGTTADPYIITATEVDGSVTNEINTAFAVNAGNLEITDSDGTLSVPLASLGTDDQNIDVLTLNAATNILTVGIENGSDLTVDLSGLVADGSETIVTGAGINVVTGTGTTADPYIITATEVDGSVTNEINTAFAVNAGNLEITDSDGTLSVPLASLGTDDQNIDVLTLNAATNILTVGIENGSDLTVDLSGLVADGSETIVTGAGINVVTGTGTTADPYIITATEVDGSVTNEINTAFAVNAGNLEITDSDGTLSVPLASLGTDDQNIDVLTLNGATNILTVGIENGSDLTVDLSGLVADGSETIVTGAGINVVTGTGTTADPYIITATEVDGSVTNEINTAFAVNAGNLEITDSDGTLSVPLASLGTDDQNIDVLTLNAATNILTVGIENGSDLTVDLSGLVADGSETIVTGAGINVVTGTGTTADPYIITATEVDGSVTNEINTAFAVNAGNLEITDSDGTLSVPLASLGTDDQNIDVLTLNAATNILTVGIENGSDLTVDLSGLVADGSETIVTGAGINVVTGTGTTADPYIITATEVDGSVTNEINTAFAVNAGNLEITDSDGTLSVPLASLGTDDQNIDVLTLNAATNILTVGIENGSDLTVDLSGLVADGSETIVTGAGINVVTGTGTTADPYIITATEVDGSVTNEINTAFAVNAGNLEITDSDGTLSVPLASLGTDDQNIDVLTLNAATNILTVGIENGSDLTVDLSGLVADGSETIVTGAGINVVTGTGTTADPYIITATEVDGSVTNEINTAFAVNAGNLEITDSDGTLSVPLASLGTDDQNIDVLTLNAATNILTVGIENGSDLTVDLSGLVADGSETIVTGAGINVVTGTGTTADPYIITATEVDGSVTNEINTAFAVNAGNLEITDSDGTLSVPLASLGTDDQNIDVLTLNAATNILTVGIENGSDLTVDLSGLVADGSETIVTGAGINVVTGTGTTADPYIITATEVDGSVTNEINTAFAVNAGNLEITDSDGTLSVPLASLGTDDQNIDVLTLNGATNILTVGIENGSDLTVDLSSLSDTETITTMTGTAGSGNAIGTYTNEASTPVVINETVTTLSQNNTTGVITYTNESATAQTADVISTDADNQITAGSDGGAYLNLPVIYSAGKVNGNGTAASIYQATVSRINEGDYQITFTTALSNANYIIQLATLDCNGDCPGNTSANYDDPGITYYDQQTSGFKINIGDSDNGTISKDDIDLEFMYTVIKLP